ncbi:MAG: hypothetical protein MZU95_06865 [Desulfomicrobium escambiense]|nr:hypothetical protein [Desulfomicrobium escambiense]
MSTDVRTHRLFLRPGGKALALRKDRKRRVFGLKHVLLLIALAGRRSSWPSARPISSSSPGTSWPSARSRSSAPRTTCSRTLDDHFGAPRLGNILLCDLDALRARRPPPGLGRGRRRPEGLPLAAA